MAGFGDYCGKFLFCICGPKCSLCCFILSIWAILMLGVETGMYGVKFRKNCVLYLGREAPAKYNGSLGIFFFIEATALFEDIKGKLTKYDNATSEFHGNLTTTYYDPKEVTEKYHNAAFACWAATGIYIFFLSLSGAFVCINRWRAKVKET